MAERSSGLFSAEDWMCRSCGNINWARRTHCNMCNAPKFQKSEARTGAGGGYNEREQVEYIRREESDDEYDEFGRKKKKYRGFLAESKEAKYTNEESDPDGEEDEENFDASKYALESDNDEENRPISPEIHAHRDLSRSSSQEKKKFSPKNSRRRSRSPAIKKSRRSRSR